jgi:hypothetical protein
LLLLTLSCLEAVLYSTSAELLGRIGGTKAAKLLDLCIWYNPADDGFDGKCFENVVHVALRDGDGVISPFIRSVVEHFCGIKGEVTSIQFGPEREGTRPTVEPARRAISDEARVYFANGAIGPRLLNENLTRSSTQAYSAS